MLHDILEHWWQGDNYTPDGWQAPKSDRTRTHLIRGAALSLTVSDLSAAYRAQLKEKDPKARTDPRDIFPAIDMILGWYFAEPSATDAVRYAYSNNDPYYQSGIHKSAFSVEITFLTLSDDSPA